MNILNYDRWIFNKLHHELLENYNREIATRTIRGLIAQMIIDNVICEDTLIKIQKSEDPENPLIKDLTDKLALYLNTDGYLSYPSNIRITQGTKDKLRDLRNNSNESYEDVILRLINHHCQ